MDLVAIGLSIACAIHCLALPLAAVMLPFLGVFSHAAWVHWLFVLLAAPTTVVALRPRETSWKVRHLAAAGLAGLVAGALEFPSEAWATPITVAAGAILALAHTINAFRMRRQGRHH